MSKYRIVGLAILWLILGAHQLHAQGCSVSLGPDTSLCAANFVLQPALSVSVFEDSLEITYDATQGQTGLVGATKVYMHSAAEMVPFGGWQNTVGNWGQDDGIGQMTQVGTDLWRIRILPHAYYNYPANVTPNGLFFVFRNADGSATGKDNSGQDIWADMGQNPPVSAFAGIQFRWITDALDSLHWSDGSHGGSLAVSSPGTYWVQMTDTSGCTATDTIVVNLGSIPLVDLGQPAICDGTPIVLDAGAGFASYTWSTGASTQTISVSSPGVITVTVTNAAGCTGSDVVNIPSSTSPTAGFGILDNFMTLQFVDNSTYATSYDWDYGDGSAHGTTPGSHSHTYSTMGIYTICLTVTNACGMDSTCQTKYVGEIGFAEPWISRFELSPNPTQRYLHLEVDFQKPRQLDWQIISSQGQQVMQGQEGRATGNLEKEFDLQDLAPGMYRLLLRADGKSVTRSFVKI